MEKPIPQMRLRLKANGRIVEVLEGGGEREIVPKRPGPRMPTTLADHESADDAAYARNIRARTRLTQAEFAERIGVPIETVRNWEQGKRSPRGPARALLKLIDSAPELAFAALAKR
jgi:putative transcriptional regulator